MEAEILFLDPDDVGAAILVLTAYGITVEILDKADTVDGMVASPAKWVMARGWSEDAGAFWTR